MNELELLKKGDRQLIQKMYQQCFRGIAGWVKNNSGNEADAEDVFHDAMVTVYQKAMQNELELTCKLSTFIFGVSKKIWMYKLRTKGRYMNTDFNSGSELTVRDDSNAQDLAIKNEVESLYIRSFNKLSAECQEILNYFFNGLSIELIAKKMNLSSANATRKKKFRCKNKLVELVEGDPQFFELKQL